MTGWRSAPNEGVQMFFKDRTKECHNCGLIAVELESGAFYQRDCPFCGAKLVDGQKVNEGLSYARVYPKTPNVTGSEGFLC